MILPHGGVLINRLVHKEDKQRLREEAVDLFEVPITYGLRKDFECIAYGIFSPLVGPHNRDDYQSILEIGRLQNEQPWTFPIVLDVSEELASAIIEGDEVVLTQSGEHFAILHVEEKYPFDRKAHAQNIYNTLDAKHPGVMKTMRMNNILLGGSISLFNETYGKFPTYKLKPKDTRLLFIEKGWKTIAGFHTRNPPHIGHEYIQRIALNNVDGLLINPLIGWKKTGDFKDEVIIDAYEYLIQNYYKGEPVTLVTLEMDMRYAGPREAIFHAIIRKNFGCTHFIIGRDHAGVGNFYGPYDAQEIFTDYPDLGIIPLCFKNVFYCSKCEGVRDCANCSHSSENHVRISGTIFRDILQKSKHPSKEIVRPEIINTIQKHSNPFIS